MRIVALEEHVSIAAFSDELERSAPAERGGRSGASRRDALEDIESARLPSMDENGITLQILSVPGPGAALLSPEAGPDYAKRYNDALAEVVRRHPTRFAAFAHLPSTAPEAAADELERAVREHGFAGALLSGMVKDKFLDDPSFAPLLARAEALEFGAGLLHRFNRARREHDFGAGRAVLQRDLFADSVSTAGDDCDFPC